ncbi:multicopper oxidase domain-containing protein [Legionella sp. PC997]|uniref:multicopper oxidase domain-containing protein n=1 Tax=Legionella sp. PC997 TaxID=2755562 RepID=UPI0015FD2E6D|nr:multicopper oxidase domain-containing protein [Legionella sp. PC997]QMT60880.1 copper oxidase [Legionella sp. PC997]
MPRRDLKLIIVSFVLFLFPSFLLAQHEHHTNAPPSITLSTPNIPSKIKKDIRKKVIHGAMLPAVNKERTINLVIEYKMVNYAGKMRRAISVNNQIPAPTLHFKEGEHVRINVYNKLDQGSSIHWHGLLVPWQMDGVENISQKAIPPGGVFHYRFTLHQAGTYWYHAHADVQEQEGLYGAFLIAPKTPVPYSYTRDYVVVLSDWSNYPANQIFANLKKDGDYFSPNLPLQPSLAKFIHDYRRANVKERKALMNDYKMMQQMRMSIYDISDVAYDAFLLNGHPKTNPWKALVKVGDVVRLRFIGAGASTIFRVKIHDTTMKMMHVQGNDVKPFTLKSFDIAPGETYDVLVAIKKNTPHIIYAESIDTVGAAVGALVTSFNQAIDYKAIPPFPEPEPTTRQMMANMMMSGMNHDSMSSHARMKHGQTESKMQGMEKNRMPMDHSMNMSSMDMSSMDMSSMGHPLRNFSDIDKTSMGMEGEMAMDKPMSMPLESTIIGDAITPIDKKTSSKTLGTKYQDLKAAVKTNNPNRSVDGVIRMELFGYMDRFIWFINGLPEYRAKPILIEPGKRYRIIFTNNSMMRHPMHIHGHWFILRNGHGAYDPLLHTINVPPGATAVADFDTDASGQWFFHCHHLYHMMAGMARAFQYETILEVAKGLKKPEYEIAKTGYYNRPIVRVDELVPINKSLISHPAGHHARFYFASSLDIGEDPFNNVQRLTYLGLYGPDYNKLELFANDAELSEGEVENADIDIFYWHQISQFWAIKGGANYFNRPAVSPYWQPGIGVEGIMPYFIATNLRNYYYKGSAKFDLELSRDTQITNNFFLRLGVRSILATKTVDGAVGSGLNQMRYVIRPYYRLTPGLNLTVEFEREQAYGSYKTILNSLGQEASENTLTFGLSMLF